MAEHRIALVPEQLALLSERFADSAAFDPRSTDQEKADVLSDFWRQVDAMLEINRLLSARRAFP